MSWWPGDGDAKDIGVGGNNGTVLGGTTFTDAKVGKGFTFSSNADRVTIPHNDNLNVQSPGFSAEFWIKGTKNQPEELFVPVDKSHGFSDSTGWVFQGRNSNGTIAFLIGAGGFSPFTNFVGVNSTRDVLDGQFHHVAGTWDGSNVRLYVEGVLQGNDALSVPFNNTRALLIGFASGGGSPQRFFRGQVDELTIYNRALTDAEILAIFQAGSAGKCKPSGSNVIVFSSTRGGNTDIYSMKDDGSDLKRLTTNSAIDTTPAWSPDRTRIAFSSNRGGNFDIYVMNPDGTDASGKPNPTKLTTQKAFNTTPTWSSDGKKIAFSSNLAGNFDIYVMNADGSGQPIPLTAANSGLDTTPDW